MTFGAGFVFDAINTMRSNRALLKGKYAAHYKNFDTAYITDSIISRKAPVYKRANKRYLKRFRAQLVKANKTRTVKKLILLAVTVIVMSLFFYLIIFK